MNRNGKYLIGEQLAEILNDYDEAVHKMAEKIIFQTSKEAVQRLRSTSPRRPGGGDYARGWRVSRRKKLGVIVHNATNYQLTHLLENGHMIVNGRGTYGRTNGIKHIKPVEEWGNEELVRRIETEIAKGLI